jgi:hypothetical protein
MTLHGAQLTAGYAHSRIAPQISTASPAVLNFPLQQSLYQKRTNTKTDRANWSYTYRVRTLVQEITTGYS